MIILTVVTLDIIDIPFLPVTVRRFLQYHVQHSTMALQSNLYITALYLAALYLAVTLYITVTEQLPKNRALYLL